MNGQEVGARIAALRTARGMTGEELGRHLGLTKSQISKIENGTRKLDVGEVAEVADALAVTLAEVLGVERRGSLALAARVMSEPDQQGTVSARRRLRQLLESEAALADAVGLPLARPSDAGAEVRRRMESADLKASATPREGSMLAEIVRAELGLGRAPVADLAALAERHFGLACTTWPVGTAVSGLCARGSDTAMVLVSSDFPRGHQRFTMAHELAHHLLDDPRELIIESDLYAVGTPTERRANAFAASLLMPRDGLREVVAGRPVDERVLTELMREFGVSYRALLYRLADDRVRLLSAQARDSWLERSPSSVLRAAGDIAPARLTRPDATERLPPRLLGAALLGYRSGQVGLGVLASLLDEDPERLYVRLADDGVLPPQVDDDLADL